MMEKKFCKVFSYKERIGIKVFELIGISLEI